MDLEDRQSKGTIKTRYIPNHPDLEDVVYGGLNVREPSSESIQAWLIQVYRRVMRHRCFGLGIPSSKKSPSYNLSQLNNEDTHEKTYSSGIVLLQQISNFTAELFTAKFVIKKLVSCESIAFSMFCQDILHEACQTMG